MARRKTVGLTNRDRAVIDLERDWGQAQQVLKYKLEAARDLLGLSPRGYALVLNALIDDPAAASYDPETLERLRAIRTQRRAATEPLDAAIPAPRSAP